MFDYGKIIIKCVDDVETLRQAILHHRGFRMKDYRRCRLQAANTEQHSRIMHRLTKHIAPLVEIETRKETKGIPQKSSINNQQKRAVSATLSAVVNDKIYKASDFKISRHLIEVDGLMLRSKRITSAEPRYLKGIEHQFRIVVESEKKKLFHFVPYTDLSVLINAIEEQKKIEAEKRLLQEFEKFKSTLPEKIKYFLNNGYKFRHGHSTGINQRISRPKLYELLLRCKLLDSDVTEHDFFNSIKECNIEVPLDDVSVFDGYVEVNLSNIKFIHAVSYEMFKDWLWDYQNLKFFKRFEDEIKDCYIAERDALREKISSKRSVRVKTHLSERSFREIFLQEKLQEVWVEGKSAMWHRHLDVFAFPVTYLMEDDNNGFDILATLPAIPLCEAIISQPYTVDESIKKELLDRISAHSWSGFDEAIHQALYLRTYDIVREVTEYYRNRVNIRTISNFSNNSRIFLIDENYRHISDDVDYNFGWGAGKATKRNPTFVIVDYENETITVSPTDSAYSVYYFNANAEQCNMDVAALALIRYFTSSIENKRQYFKIYDIFNVLGLWGLTKW